MTSSFIIQPSRINTDSADLYIEIKSQGLSYIIIDNNACAALATFHFTAGATSEVAVSAIHQVITEQPVLQQPFKNVYIIYGYSQSVLVPNEYMSGDDNNEMLELVFGDSGESIVRNDYIYRHMIHNVYSVPTEVDAVVKRYFENASVSHLFSLLPDIIKNSGTHLYCIFNTGQLTVLLQKDGKLQVVQNFPYKIPDDVSYHLLNICRSYEVNVNEVTVHLTGMIDAASALYNELYKYFLHLFFEALPEEFEYPENMQKHPAHYFSHLFAVASCV